MAYTKDRVGKGRPRKDANGDFSPEFRVSLSTYRDTARILVTRHEFTKEAGWCIQQSSLQVHLGLPYDPPSALYQSAEKAEEFLQAFILNHLGNQLRLVFDAPEGSPAEEGGLPQ